MKSNPENNSNYYQTPIWYAALKWVKITKLIEEAKFKIYKNQINLSPEKKSK